MLLELPLGQSFLLACDNFVTFCWLSLQLANQNPTTVRVGVGVIKLHVGFPTNVNSTTDSNMHFDRSFKQKTTRKLSKRCHKFVTNKLIKDVNPGSLVFGSFVGRLYRRSTIYKPVTFTGRKYEGFSTKGFELFCNHKRTR